MNKEDFKYIQINAYLRELQKRFDGEMCIVRKACDSMNVSISTFPENIQHIKLRLECAEAFYQEWKRVKAENNFA